MNLLDKIRVVTGTSTSRGIDSQYRANQPDKQPYRLRHAGSGRREDRMANFPCKYGANAINDMSSGIKQIAVYTEEMNKLAGKVSRWRRNYSC